MLVENMRAHTQNIWLGPEKYFEGDKWMTIVIPCQKWKWLYYKVQCFSTSVILWFYGTRVKLQAYFGSSNDCE